MATDEGYRRAMKRVTEELSKPMMSPERLKAKEERRRRREREKGQQAKKPIDRKSDGK